MRQRLASVLRRMRRLSIVLPALALIVVAALALLAFPHAGAGVTTASATATTAPTSQTSIRRFSVTGDGVTVTPTDTGVPQATATTPPAPTATATQPPAPTATPAPGWHTVGAYSGASSQALATLDSSYQGDHLQVMWTCTYTDALPSWMIGVSAPNESAGVTCAAQYPTSGVFDLGTDSASSFAITLQDDAGGQWTATVEAYY